MSIHRTFSNVRNVSCMYLKLSNHQEYANDRMELIIMMTHLWDSHRNHESIVRMALFDVWVRLFPLYTPVISQNIVGKNSWDLMSTGRLVLPQSTCTLANCVTVGSIDAPGKYTDAVHIEHVFTSSDGLIVRTRSCWSFRRRYRVFIPLNCKE